MKYIKVEVKFNIAVPADLSDNTDSITDYINDKLKNDSDFKNFIDDSMLSINDDLIII